MLVIGRGFAVSTINEYNYIMVLNRHYVIWFSHQLIY